MPTYVLTTEDPDAGPSSWEESSGGLTPGLTASLEANWPRDPDELHLWAPGWGISTTFTANDTIYLLAGDMVDIPNMAGCWTYLIGPTGGGSQGYNVGFHMQSTLFGDGTFTPTAVRVTCFSTLTAQDASPVGIVGTLRIYATDDDGDRVLAATFASTEGTVLPLTGATPFAFSIPLSGVALPINGRIWLVLTLGLFDDDDGLNNNVEFGFEGLHLTFE